MRIFGVVTASAHTEHQPLKMHLPALAFLALSPMFWVTIIGLSLPPSTLNGNAPPISPHDFFLDCLKAIEALPNDKKGATLPEVFSAKADVEPLYRLPRSEIYNSCEAKAKFKTGSDRDWSSWGDAKARLHRVNEICYRDHLLRSRDHVGALGGIEVWILSKSPKPSMGASQTNNSLISVPDLSEVNQVETS